MSSKQDWKDQKQERKQEHGALRFPWHPKRPFALQKNFQKSFQKNLRKSLQTHEEEQEEEQKRTRRRRTRRSKEKEDKEKREKKDKEDKFRKHKFSDKLRECILHVALQILTAWIPLFACSLTSYLQEISNFREMKIPANSQEGRIAVPHPTHIRNTRSNGTAWASIQSLRVRVTTIPLLQVPQIGNRHAGAPCGDTK